MPPRGRPARRHRVIGDTEAELDERTQELIASGQGYGDGALNSTWVPALRSSVKDAAPRPGHERAAFQFHCTQSDVSSIAT